MPGERPEDHTNEELAISAVEALHTCLRLLMRFAFRRRLTHDARRDLVQHLEYAKDRVEKMRS